MDNDLKEISDAIKNIPETTSLTYNILIKSKMNKQDANGVWTCFEDMKSKSIEPDRFTYDMLIRKNG